MIPDLIDETALNVYVDGSSIPGPRRGGVGIRYFWVDAQGDVQSDIEPFPYSHEGASNNQMELQAPIQALKTALGRRPPIDLKTVARIVIYSDSRYFVDYLYNARYVWPKTGWTKRDGGPVDNVRQWMELRKLCDRAYQQHRLRVEVTWIPGKKGDYAKSVDKEAKKAAKDGLKTKLDHQQVRRKWSPLEVTQGCIRARGQTEIIRIVTDKQVGRDRISKHIYEVINEASPDHQLVDYVYTDLLLKAGHVYRVVLNNEPLNPRILQAEEWPKQRRIWDATVARRAAIVDALRYLRVTGVLIKAAEQGKVPEVACSMPRCLCPEEVGGRRYFEPKSQPQVDWMPTPDHYPILKKDGGKLSVDNVRLAHRICNRVDYAIQTGKPHKRDEDRAADLKRRFNTPPVTRRMSDTCSTHLQMSQAKVTRRSLVRNAGSGPICQPSYMSKTWDDEAENWVKWARTPGHDVYAFYSPSFFEEILPSGAGLTLEVGCGEGRVVRDLKRAGHRVIGLDPSPTLIRHASAADPEGVYVVARGEQIPFRDASFALVVAYNSLQNVGDLSKAVAEAERVLKPAGQFCICIAHPMSDAGRFEDGEPEAPFVVKGSYYGPRRVDEKVERAGLEITFHGLAYSLEEYTRALEESGFVIDLLREPRPDDEAVLRRPGLAQWQRVPLFLFLRAIRCS